MPCHNCLFDLERSIFSKLRVERILLYSVQKMPTRPTHPTQAWKISQELSVSLNRNKKYMQLNVASVHIFNGLHVCFRQCCGEEIIVFDFQMWIVYFWSIFIIPFSPLDFAQTASVIILYIIFTLECWISKFAPNVLYSVILSIVFIMDLIQYKYCSWFCENILNWKMNFLIMTVSMLSCYQISYLFVSVWNWDARPDS